MSFEKSHALQPRFNALIPGGAHTYAKGDDQWPEHYAPYISHGVGSHVWDVDGNEYIEYGMGLRAVTLGHAYPPVIEAARAQMGRGANFIRPAHIELECAEQFLRFITGAEMVKFAKDGSDVTSGAVRLARAYTGRDLVAICAQHPFFSVDDWFIGTTPVNAGIPSATRELTLKFNYNDLPSLERLFDAYPGRIACVMLEPERDVPPRDGFLSAAAALCRARGAVFVLDEMITGFRWDTGGAQRLHGVVPDLSTFGKALGNGFAIAALAGRRELMRLGGLDHDQPRVFLLSTTHGAETHALAATMATLRVYEAEDVIGTLHRQGERLATGVRQAIAANDLEGVVTVSGRPCCLYYGTRDAAGQPSQPFRTLFLQETVKRGLLAPQLIVSYSHTDADIDRTIAIIGEALGVYRRALTEGVDRYLEGRPVKPVYRVHN